MISIDKKYKTRGGNSVRILCVDRIDNAYPVIGLVMNGEEENLMSWTNNGKWAALAYTDDDLVEVNERDDFKIDDPVLVSTDNKEWHNRYFAGISDNGLPKAWLDGRTSWTISLTTEWKFCRKPTKEELGS